jgi:hypothetical protein
MYELQWSSPLLQCKVWWSLDWWSIVLAMMAAKVTIDKGRGAHVRVSPAAAVLRDPRIMNKRKLLRLLPCRMAYHCIGRS